MDSHFKKWGINVIKAKTVAECKTILEQNPNLKHNSKFRILCTVPEAKDDSKGLAKQFVTPKLNHSNIHSRFPLLEQSSRSILRCYSMCTVIVCTKRFQSKKLRHWLTQVYIFWGQEFLPVYVIIQKKKKKKLRRAQNYNFLTRLGRAW